MHLCIFMSMHIYVFIYLFIFAFEGGVNYVDILSCSSRMFRCLLLHASHASFPNHSHVYIGCSRVTKRIRIVFKF